MIYINNALIHIVNLKFILPVFLTYTKSINFKKEQYGAMNYNIH
jgi:hypothetical protein